MRSFTIYMLPAQLVEDFLSETYGIIDQLWIDLKPIPPEQATMKMNRYVKLIKGMLLADEAKRRSPDADKVVKYRMAEEALNDLISGQSRLFEARIVLSVSGKDGNELKHRAKLLKDALQSRLIQIDSPSYLQYPLAMGKEGKKLIVDTTTAGTFFPFVSADVIKLPDGIFLGVNRLTGSPIIFDPMLRSNYNISILGVSGSGKSFSGKIILTRMVQRNKDLPFFVIDPENEYVRLGELLGASIVEFEPGRELGLDPLAVFPRLDAADLLAEMIHIPPRLHITLRTLAFKNASLRELYESAPDELKQYLESLVEGPESFIFNGEPLDFSSKMVFALKRLDSEFLKQMISILVFGKVWRMLNDETFAPKQQEKLVLVDEAWLYMQVPAAARFLERISRLGRKRNIVFLILTQRPALVVCSLAYPYRIVPIFLERMD